MVAHSKWSSRSSTHWLPTLPLFEAPDMVTNLKEVGDRFGHEVGDLEKKTWK